jgi:hypothetical protein
MRFYIFFILWLVSSKIQAQPTVKGKAIDSLNHPIAFATISLKAISSQEVLKYAFTDEDGKYTIELPENLDSLLIEFSHLEFENLVKRIINKPQIVDFKIAPSQKMLAEVVVKSSPIYEKGDTLNFNVASFISKNDRTLADVLKKIPGIEVDADGRIKYLGAYINKFYVEGKDLMQGDYNILTQSLPTSDALTIQVLQNHQPTKILKDKVYSPYAGINIKLKKNISLTGRAELGVGAGPFLYSSNVLPILFSKKIQMLVGLKANNIGEILNKDAGNNINFASYENMPIGNKKAEWMSIAKLQNPQIFNRSLIFNQDIIFTGNILFSGKKEWEFRNNVELVRSTTNGFGEETTTTEVPGNNSFTVQKNAENEHTVRYMSNSLSLTENTEKKYIRNTFFVKKGLGFDVGEMILQQNGFQQVLKESFAQIDNSFNSIFSVRKKLNIGFQSVFNYLYQTPSYTIFPTTSLVFDSINLSIDSRLTQRVRHKEINFENSTSITLSKKQFTAILNVKHSFSSNYLKSFLLENEKTELSYMNWINEFQLLLNKVQTGFNLNYNGKKLKVNSFFPLNIYSLRKTDKIRINESIYRVVLEPNINAEYKLSTAFKATFSAEKSYTLSDIQSIAGGNILSALNQYSNNNLIVGNSQVVIVPGLNYLNAKSGIFGRLYSSAIWGTNANVSSQSISANGQVSQSQENFRNKNRGISFSAIAGGYFNKIKTNFFMTFTTGKSEGNIIFNNNYQQYVLSNNSAEIYIASGIFKKVYIISTTTINTLKRIAGSNENTMTQLGEKLNISYNPTERHSVTIESQNTYGYGIKFNYTLFNMSYQYSIPKKKVDISLNWLNIFNQKNYTQAIISNIYTSISTFRLRPSQVVFSLKFNIRK